MRLTVQVKGNVTWKWGRTKSGNYIGICDPISQTVQAPSFRELLETMHEALDSTLRELFSTGDLEKFLRDQGWEMDKTVPQIKKNARFDMPFDLTGVRNRDLQEAVC